MSRGRKPLAAAEQVGPTFVGKTPAAMAASETEMRNQQASMEDALRLGLSLGQMQMAAMHETISQIAQIAAYEKAKDSSAYKHIINPVTRNHFASLEEFCEVAIGISLRRVQQLASNRNAIGQQSFEQTQRIGFRQVDYNAIKALPAPKLEIVQQAIADGSSRDEVVQLIQELAAADQREIESLTAERDELKASGVAKDRLIADKTAKLDKLALERRRIKTVEPDAVLIDLRRELMQYAISAEGEIVNRLRPAFAAMRDHHVAHGGDSTDYLAGCLGQIERVIDELREEFELPARGASWEAGEE